MQISLIRQENISVALRLPLQGVTLHSDETFQLSNAQIQNTYSSRKTKWCIK